MKGAETKKKSLIGWIMEFANTKRSLYVASVILATCGVICSMIPYYFVGRIVQKLFAHEREFSAYRWDFAVIAAAWTLRVLFHSASTARSHVATFSVLGNIRKAICTKLTRVPLGDVQNIP